MGADRRTVRSVPRLAIARRAVPGLAAAAVAVATALPAAPARADVGFRDFNYGSRPSAPTGQKPQSKLWFHDGFWWGALFNAFTARFEIHRLDPSDDTWSTTGVAADDRPRAWSDSLWDGTHLYIVSAVHGTSYADGAKLWRYSYDAAARTYTANAGYPVQLSDAGSEAVVIDKDGGGRLWITYTHDKRVWVAHSTVDDRTWTAPYVLPAPGSTTLTADDISSLIAYEGNVGVMWSNQNDSATYWASHADGAPDSSWTPNTALRQTGYTDDHINLKSLGSDPAGKVVALVKTSLNAPTAPLQLLYVLGNDGVWRHHTVATVADDATRAQIAVDREQRQLFVMYSVPCCSGGSIHYKRSSLDAIYFAPGVGTPLVQSSQDPSINNVSTTKQALTSQSGLVAIGGDDNTRFYLHNRLALGGGDSLPPDTQIVAGPQGAVSSASATFEFASTETGSTFECSIDGGAYSPCSSPVTYGGLADGEHVFAVRATDPAGNVDPTPAERRWTITANIATSTFHAVADAHVSEFKPSTNYGSAATLITDARPDKASYMRFSVSGITAPVIDAKVRTFVRNGSVNGPAIHPTSGAWTESGITWANRPPPTAAASDDKGAVAAGAWVEYDVTPLVPGNGTYDFVTLTTSTDALDVDSRETANAPQLVVTFDPPPDTWIASGPSGAVAATTAVFEFAASGPEATYECRIDGSAWAGCTSPRTYTDLSQGAHSFEVRAIDPLTGIADPTPAARTWTVDTIAPSPPTIALDPTSDTGRADDDHVTADRTPLLRGVAEPGARVDISVEGERLGTAAVDASGAWSFVTGALADGDHVLIAETEDAAGNLSAGASLRIRVDTSEPDAPSIVRPADGSLTSATTVVVAGTAEPGAEVTILDGNRPAATTTADAAARFELELAGLADGPHPLSARATDVAGNTSAGAPTVTLTVDTTAPDTTIDSGPPDPSPSRSASFAFSSSEPAGATFECRLDGGAFASCASPLTLAGLADGRHLLEVRARDAAGNVDASPASHSWTVDESVPDAPTISEPADGSVTAAARVTVAGTAPAGATVDVLEGPTTHGSAVADAGGAWRVELPALADGPHTLTARAHAGGAASGLSNAVTVTVDTQPPQTTIDSAPASPSPSSSAELSFSSSESRASFECSIDGAPWQACIAPLRLQGLADGPHELAVRALDAAGNVDPTPATHAWTVDTQPPQTQIDGGPSGTVTTTAATFTFSSPDAGASFRCRLDGGPFAACASPATYTGLAPGAHSFEVKAVDAAGNEDPTPATRTWTISAVVFADGFESGNLSAWSVVQTGADGTATVQGAVVAVGAFAAELAATSTSGSRAFARATLPSAQTALVVAGHFRVAQEGASGANVPLLRLLDGAGARLVNLIRQNRDGDRVYVGDAVGYVATGARLALGAWSRFELHVVAAGAGASTIVLLQDGIEVHRSTTASIAAGGVHSVQIGNDTSRQTFRLQADEIEVRRRG